MIETLDQRQRKWLALAILALVSAVFVSLTVVPVWSTNQRYRSAIEDAQRRLEQLNHAAAVGGSLQSQFDQLKRSQVAAAHTLKSTTPALAGAELQRIVNRVLATSNAEMVSTQILTAVEEQDFVRIALKVRMRSTLRSVVDVFYALETDEPFLFLDKIAIRSLYARSRGRTDGGATLETDFELTGYMPRNS